jgi:hypothetical protein
MKLTGIPGKKDRVTDELSEIIGDFRRALPPVYRADGDLIAHAMELADLVVRILLASRVRRVG